MPGFRELGIGIPHYGDWYLEAGTPIQCTVESHSHAARQLLEALP